MYDRFDRRIHYLRVSVTDRCNLRCTYCMPAEGVPLMRHQDLLAFEEIADVVRAAVDLGVDKVRLTGGEPLVRKGIVDLVRLLAAIPGITDLSMTTNGQLLPECAAALRQAGLHRLNISLDTVDAERYRGITRGGELSRALAGIAAARAAGFQPIKLNCVVENHADESDARSVAFFAHEQDLPVRFIRRMDMGTGSFFRVQGGDGGDCENCNRLRLTSDGLVKPCLFSDLAFSVREHGASQALRLAVADKPSCGSSTTHHMHRIGG